MSNHQTKSFRPRLCCLENRCVPTAVPLSPGEQYLLELVNRARLDPAGEAARYSIDLNEGLPAGTISSTPKQPLAANSSLYNAIRGHLIDMQTHSFFSHTGSNGSTPQSRMATQGYGGTVGENLALGTAIADETANIEQLHRLLFVDSGIADRGHRTNMLSGVFREVGTGVHSGPFTYSNGVTQNSLLIGEDFGAQGSLSFLTGVAYSDTVRADNFYTPGEGKGGITIQAKNSLGQTFSDTTGTSGGYQLQLPAGSYTVTFTANGLTPFVSNVVIGSQNVKLDYRTDQAVPQAPLPYTGTQYALGADAGTTPTVKVIDAATGTVRYTFNAYDPNFRGGVRVATGDVNGDGALDIITAPGPGGGPHVKIYDGKTLDLISQFYAYGPSFAGGVFLAAGDVNNDGFAEIITGAGAGGGPHVRVLTGTGQVVSEFMAYTPSFAGGVSVAAGDVNGDGKADVITGAGKGGGPHVRVFDHGDSSQVITEFFAYAPAFNGGVFVATGDVDNNGRDEIITAPASNGGPHVRIFNVNPFAELRSFYATDSSYSGGVRVATTDVNGDNRAELVVGLGTGAPQRARIFDPFTLADSYSLSTQAGGLGDKIYVG